MLFGHQPNDSASQAPAGPTPTTDSATPVDTNTVPQNGVNPLAVDPATGVSLPVAPPEPLTEDDLAAPSILNQPTNEPAAPPVPPPSAFNADDPFGQAAPDVISPSEPPTPTPTAPDFVNTPELSVSPANNGNYIDALASETPDPAQPTASTSTPSANAPADLLELKQQALGQLSPLIGQLDQSPEERFRTTMMLIQSTDNPDLIRQAYEAAQQISDEKVRAQALLDVVNEINYFTQKPAS